MVPIKRMTHQIHLDFIALIRNLLKLVNLSGFGTLEKLLGVNGWISGTERSFSETIDRSFVGSAMDAGMVLLVKISFKVLVQL